MTADGSVKQFWQFWGVVLPVIAVVFAVWWWIEDRDAAECERGTCPIGLHAQMVRRVGCLCIATPRKP